MTSPDRAGLKRRKWLVLGIVAALVTAVLLFAFGRPAISSYVQQKLVDQARAQGVILHLSGVEVTPSSIQLRDARAELDGVKGISAAIDSAEVTLTRFEATRIQVKGMRVQAIGAPLELMRELDTWRARFDTQTKANVPPRPEFENTNFAWRATPDAPNFLQIDDVRFASDDTGPGPKGSDWSVTAASARTGVYDLKPLALALHYEKDAIEVGFGATHLARALVRGGWQRQPDADDFHVTFEELPMGPLLGSLNIPATAAKLAAAECKGGISIRVSKDEKIPYTGRFDFDVRGWVPPHPPELDGFAFGTSTTLQSGFEVARDLTNARLMGLALSSGALKLAGQGLIQLASLTSAHVKAELKGQLPCAALASAMAESKLGKAYGRWVARNAGRTVQGQVDVAVQIDADTAHLDKAKIAKQVGVGCGLKPLSLRDMLALGLPPMPDADFLKHAAQNLPSLAAGLPALPSALPKLPPMPTVKLPTFGDEK